MMTVSSAQTGRPMINGADGSYRSGNVDVGMDLDADGFPRQPPPQRPTASSSTALSPSSPSTVPPRLSSAPDLDDAPSEPPRAGFSFPALHLGSFSSLKMDDFANFPSSTSNDEDNMTGIVRTSTPAGNDVAMEEKGEDGKGQDAAGGNSQLLVSPRSPLGASATSPDGTTARPSPSLYDVTRMARSSSPFRPVPATNSNDTATVRSAHQLQTDQGGLDQDGAEEPDAFLNLPPRTLATSNTTDYLIDSPGFLSEEGSQAFLRQSRIARRRTIVQDPNESRGNGEDGDAYAGQVRSRQGSRDMMMDGNEGVPSRKASTVGQLDSVHEATDVPEVPLSQGLAPAIPPAATNSPQPRRPSLDAPRHSFPTSLEPRRRRLPSAPSARSIPGLGSSREDQGQDHNDQDGEDNRRAAQEVFDQANGNIALGQAITTVDQAEGHLGGKAAVRVASGSDRHPRSPPVPTGPLHPDITSTDRPLVGQSMSTSQVPQISHGPSQSMGSRGEDGDRRKGLNPNSRTPPRAYAALPPIQTQANAGVNLDSMPSLPMFPGISKDEGPYPSYARPRKSTDRDDPSIRRMSDGKIVAGRYRAGEDGPPLRIKVPPPQEEICLECLMRDRDLMHVDVTGEGVWERASDIDWHERLEREDMCVQQFRRDPENRRKREDCEGEARARLESMLLREEDNLVDREVGWRGFSWEEGENGTGLPRHFRGNVEGELLEERLRELATKMNAPAAHRFKTLQVYLRDQAASVGLVHPMARRAEMDAAMSRQSMVSPPAQLAPAMRSQDPAMLPPHLRPSQSHGMLQEPVDYQRGGPTRRLPQHSHHLDPVQRATMYAKPMEEPAFPSGQNSAYTRSKTIPAIALGGPLPSNRDATHSRAPPLQLDLRKGKGISSPGLLEGMSPDPNAYDDAINDRSSGRYDSGDQASISDSPIRPFSFAVWAGNGGQHSARSSPGPGRDRRNSSALGRWGGSVTSFFSGSQGGASGSMMDMHLGLDQDRRRGLRALSPLPQPRSVSMASPPRPNFFSRASASFQTHAPSLRQGQQGNLSTSDTGSFADEPRAQEPVIAEKKKKKGFKGFLQKLGGGNKKRSSDSSERDRAGRAEDDYSTPLPPPPSLSILMERSDRSSKHTRSPSNSSLSGSMAQTPGNQIASGRPSYSNDQSQQRSVSAPMVKSPSKSSLPNTSPTSSRYPYGRDNYGNGNASGYQRDSYASSSTGRRRSSIPGLFNGAGPESVDDRRMDATVEVLEGEDGREYRSNGWNEDATQYPPARFSQDRGGPGSMTNSSGTLLAPSIETPMMGSVPAIQTGRSPYSRSASDNQKTLPPLPAQQGDYSLQQDYPSPMRSPDSFNAFFGQGTTMSPNMNQPPAPYNAHGRTPSSGQRSFASGVSFKDEPQRAHKTKSKFGLRGLFSGGNKQGSPADALQYGQQYGSQASGTSDFDDLARAKSAGPQWTAPTGGPVGSPILQNGGRPMRQPHDERARRTYYQ